MPKWVDVEGIVLSEMSDRERQMRYDLTYKCNLKALELIETEQNDDFQGLKDPGQWEAIGQSINFQLSVSSGDVIYSMMIIVIYTVLYP